jgi:hypothetical protein
MMDGKEKIVIDRADQLFVIPEDMLESYRIPLDEIVPSILREVGVPNEQEIPEEKLEEKLASWVNPVIGVIPDDLLPKKE